MIFSGGYQSLKFRLIKILPLVSRNTIDESIVFAIHITLTFFVSDILTTDVDECV